MPVLPPEVADLLRAGRGVFTLAAARGVSADRVQRLAGRGLLERVGRGAYASKAQLARADPWAEHDLRARGFVAACGEPVLLSGWSAVAVRRLRALGAPPPLPGAVRPVEAGGGSTRTPYGVVRRVRIPPEHRGEFTGCPVVGSAWLAADLARHAPRDRALVVADAVLASGSTRTRLRRALATMTGWPGTARSAWVVERADARAESVLETLGRLACLDHDLPVPLSNVWIGPGYPLYRVDHLWPWHGVVAEADGALKYRGVPDPAAVVAREKERQWLIQRELGLDVVRYGWDLAARHRDRLAARFAQVLAANPIRTDPVPWWPTDDPFIGQDGQLIA